MKILYVSPEVPALGGAGIATYLEEATRALSNAGHSCHVLGWSDSISKPRRQQQPGHTLHLRSSAVSADDPFLGVDPDLRLSKSIADWVLELHREHNFDVIEGTDWCAPLYCLLQVRNSVPELKQCVVSVFNHGTTYNIARYQRTFTPRQVFQRVNLEYQCIRLADLVICPSESARAEVLDTHDASRERTRVIPEPMAWDSRSLPQRPITKLLYFGSVGVSKGLNEFIEVANGYLRRNPELKVEFIGPVHALGQSEREFKEGVSRRLHTDVGSIAFSGAVPRSDALEAIGPQHLLINMSQRETFCYAFAEGIMQGACPIARAGTAQAEFIPEHLRAKFSGDGAPIDLPQILPNDLCAIRAHVRARTAPAAYADAYEKLISDRLQSTRRRANAVRFSGRDITVLIPAHNPDDLLIEALESVRQQTVMPQRIIVGNDGSKGAQALSVLRQAASMPDTTVIDFEWGGLAETRNRLLDACETNLFAFVDADDLLMPKFIEASLRSINADYGHGVRSVQGWYELYGAQTGSRGPVVFQHFSHALWNDLKNNHVGVTEVFRDLRYNSSLNQGEAEDWELWLRYFKSGWETRVIPQVLWRYRRHPGAMSSRWSEAMSVGTARANMRVLRSALSLRSRDHVWDFIGEYMYLGETFFNSLSPTADTSPYRQSTNYTSISKLEQRLSQFLLRGAPPTLKQKLAIRAMRSLARALK